jgi:hypothetical protein
MKGVSTRRSTALAALAAAACGALLAAFGVFGANGATPRTGPLTVRSGLDRPRQYVRSDGLFDSQGRRTQLGAAVSGAMFGPLSPVAVRSSDGTIAYNTWTELKPVDSDRSFSAQGIATGDPLGIPSVRVHDSSGHDWLLDRGAYSAAWRADGAIAFVKGTDPVFRAGQTYDGDVVVQAGVHGREAAWTTQPGHYVVYRWAGNRLLFDRVGLGERLQLFVADGPGRIRALADGSPIAVSPDGTRVAVVGEDGTNVRVLDIATGRELAWLDVTTTTPALKWVADSGSWVGDHIVAPASAGLAVFSASGGSLALEQVLALDQAQFPAGVQDPRFTDADGNQIEAVADEPPANGDDGVSFLLSCDRVSRSCLRGDPVPARDWLRPIDDEGGR